MVFGVVSSEGPHHATSHLRSRLESQHQSVPGCAEECDGSPGAIRWPVADLGCGSKTRRRPTSPNRPRLGLRRSATTLYPSLTAPPLPTRTRWTTSFGHMSRTSPTWPPTTPKTAWLPPSAECSLIFRRALVEKVCSQFRICIEAVIWGPEGSYIKQMSALLDNQVTWIDFFNKKF